MIPRKLHCRARGDSVAARLGAQMTVSRCKLTAQQLSYCYLVFHFLCNLSRSYLLLPDFFSNTSTKIEHPASPMTSRYHWLRETELLLKEGFPTLISRCILCNGIQDFPTSLQKILVACL